MTIGLMDWFQGATSNFTSISDISPDLSGKTFVITGANSGIGLATTRQLAFKNARILMLCRSAERTIPVLNKIIEESKNEKIELVVCDLSDWNSVIVAAKIIKSKVDHIDALINNAGILGVLTFTTCKQGMELHLSSNHFGHYILTRELMQCIGSKGEGRIINVSSNVHASATVSTGYFSSIQGFDYTSNESKSYAPYKNYCQV